MDAAGSRISQKAATGKPATARRSAAWYRRDEFQYLLMAAPGMLLLLIFNFVPMLGSVIAFQKFTPARGVLRSPWVGLANFTYMFRITDSRQVFSNTLFIAISKLALMLVASVLFALLLNELRLRYLKSIVQTVAYLPHFLSWVILAIMVRDAFALKGSVNQLLGFTGIQPIYFLGSNQWFPAVLIGTDVWKEFGFSAVIFLAALTGISPELFEAAAIDGAGRLQRIVYITLPCIAPTVTLVACLSLGSNLNAGFDQIFNLYGPLVYRSSDIIDTYVYRMGLLQAQYGLATAVGLLKSVIAFVLIVLSYWLARRFANYEIF